MVNIHHKGTPKEYTVIVHEDSVVVTFPENSVYDDNEQLLIQRHHKRVQESACVLVNELR